MKDMISERLVLLSNAQENMMEIADIMDQWESSQSNLEKNTYDSINISDRILNLSKESNNLLAKLQGHYAGCCSATSPEDVKQMSASLEEIKIIFKSIMDASVKASEISHHLEKETAFQKEIKESMKHAVKQVGESVDSAVACAEFMLAEL